MRYYIASDPVNYEKAILLNEVLSARGHEHSQDRMCREGAVTDELLLGELTFSEFRAVRDAELVVVLLPARPETYTELGAALATRGNKRIILWSETGEEFDIFDPVCSFCFHPSAERVVCPFPELLKLLDGVRISGELAND
ncbi:MAG: hypothetical protein J5854_03350 [Clostridia bacterium]|nr:hypothetical protein [Clostridia bacterium]